MVERNEDWQKQQTERAASQADKAASSVEQKIFHELFESISKQQEQLLGTRRNSQADPDRVDDFSKNAAFQRLLEKKEHGRLSPEESAILTLSQEAGNDNKYHALSKKALLEAEGKGPRLSNEERADLFAKARFPHEPKYKTLAERDYLSSWGESHLSLHKEEMADLIAHDKFSGDKEAEDLYKRSFLGQKLWPWEKDKLEKAETESRHSGFRAQEKDDESQALANGRDAWNRFFSGDKVNENRLSWKDHYKERSLDDKTAQQCQSGFGLVRNTYGESALWEKSVMGWLTTPFGTHTRKELAAHFGFKPEFGEYSEAVMKNVEGSCRAGLDAREEVQALDRGIAKDKAAAANLVQNIDKQFAEGEERVSVTKVTPMRDGGALTGKDLYLAEALRKRADIQTSVSNEWVVAERKDRASSEPKQDFARDLLAQSSSWEGDVVPSNPSAQQLRQAESTLQACAKAFPTLDLHAAFPSMDKNANTSSPISGKFLLSQSDLKDFSSNYSRQQHTLADLGVNTATPEAAARGCAHVLNEYRSYRKKEGAGIWLDTYHAEKGKLASTIAEDIWNSSRTKITEMSKGSDTSESHMPLPLYKLDSKDRFDGRDNLPFNDEQRELARELQKRLPENLKLVAGVRNDSSNGKNSYYLMVTGRENTDATLEELAADGDLFINHRPARNLEDFHDTTANKSLEQEVANELESKIWNAFDGKNPDLNSVESIMERFTNQAKKEHPQILDSWWAVEQGLDNAISKHQIKLLSNVYSNNLPSNWYTNRRARATVKSPAFQFLESAHKARDKYPHFSD